MGRIKMLSLTLDPLRSEVLLGLLSGLGGREVYDSSRTNNVLSNLILQQNQDVTLFALVF